jgi:carbon monoxide dehydrogenase subunit G
MKVELDGSFEVASSVEESFGFLSDPTRFAPLLPYFKELKEVGDLGFTVVLEIGVPQIRGRAEVEVRLVEKAFPVRARYRSRGRHALGMIDSDLGFELQPLAAGAAVSWSSVSVVNGTLASLAQGILVPLAKRQIKSMVKSFQDALQPTAGAARTSAAGLPGDTSPPRGPIANNTSGTNL